MNNLIKTIEESVVTKLQATKFGIVPARSILIQRYNGEFDGQYGLPNEFNPRTPYILVEATNFRYDYATSSKSDLKCEGSLKLYIGAQLKNQIEVRDAIGELLLGSANVLHSAKIVGSNNEPVCESFLQTEDQYLVIKNHIVWTQSFQTKTLLLSLGSK